MKPSHLPLRATIGAYILNSGLAKRGLEGEAAEAMHGMASEAIPQLKQMNPQRFGRMLSNAEIALGAALLAPMIPSALAGAGLAGFGSGLMRLYWKTPGMHEPNDPRPTQQGSAIAKDVWLVGAGLTMLLDDLLLRRRGNGRRKRAPRNRMAPRLRLGAS
jgi:hypothetical protein